MKEKWGIIVLPHFFSIERKHNRMTNLSIMCTSHSRGHDLAHLIDLCSVAKMIVGAFGKNNIEHFFKSS